MRGLRLDAAGTVLDAQPLDLMIGSRPDVAGHVDGFFVVAAGAAGTPARPGAAATAPIIDGTPIALDATPTDHAGGGFLGALSVDRLDEELCRRRGHGGKRRLGPTGDRAAGNDRTGDGVAGEAEAMSSRRYGCLRTGRMTRRVRTWISTGAAACRQDTLTDPAAACAR